MKMMTFDEAPIVLNRPDLQARRLQDRDSAQVIEMHLSPGAELADHVTPVDVFFYVIQGEVTFRIGEENQGAAAGALVESPRDVPHGFTNSERGEAVILVTKSPRP